MAKRSKPLKTAARRAKKANDEERELRVREMIARVKRQSQGPPKQKPK